MDNVLQTALAEAINSLASFFGTTTEAIMAHAPEFLAKYGWYSTLNNLPLTIMGVVLIAGILCLMGLLILMACDSELQHPLLTVVGIFIFCLIVGVGVKIIACVVAPEIVGAHAILDLLKNAK